MTARLSDSHRNPTRGMASLLCLWLLLSCSAAGAQGGFVPPEKVNPDVSPALDPDFDREAWLVYTYKVDTRGRVADATIHSSNGIPEVDDSMLEQIRALRYRPATRNGTPVEVTLGPVVYTSILDMPRRMSESFSETYDRAWERFRAEDYDGAFELAAELKKMPGRNAYEEVKFQVLAASIANRWDDATAEMQHLQRVVELQDLADRNGFQHPYVEPRQFALMLERIHAMQLANNQLADAQATFNRVLKRGTDDAVVQRMQEAQQSTQETFIADPEPAMAGELTPLYREGTGTWEARLSRDRLRIDDVRGEVDWLYLSCRDGQKRLPYPSPEPWSVPDGWKDCSVEISGRAGTRFQLLQLR